MKTIKIFAIAASLFSATAIFAADTNGLAIIPKPQQIQMGDGVFVLTPQTGISADWDSRQTAKQLAEQLRPATGYSLSVKTRRFSSAPVPGAIFLTKKD